MEFVILLYLCIAACFGGLFVKGLGELGGPESTAEYLEQSTGHRVSKGDVIYATILFAVLWPLAVYVLIKEHKHEEE